jgi:hypothetical protein
MIRKKLGTCIVAAIISIGASTYLASSANAAPMNARCSDTQMAYARGYAAGACNGNGTVDSCDADGAGFGFSYHCN